MKRRRHTSVGLHRDPQVRPGWSPPPTGTGSASTSGRGATGRPRSLPSKGGGLLGADRIRSLAIERRPTRVG
jgi:hypothetical protein